MVSYRLAQRKAGRVDQNNLRPCFLRLASSNKRQSRAKHRGVWGRGVTKEKKNGAFLANLEESSYLCGGNIEERKNMCTGYIKINDEVMEMVKPHFDGDKELWAWVEKVVDQAMKDYAAQFKTTVEKSENEHIYEQIKALENDPKGFLKLSGILKPSRYSAEDLRDEYISEKYGV
jgi:hypothetical protein